MDAREERGMQLAGKPKTRMGKAILRIRIAYLESVINSGEYSVFLVEQLKRELATLRSKKDKKVKKHGDKCDL